MPGRSYPFTESDSNRSHDEWGANCGPNALVCVEFETRKYMSPTMMERAIRECGSARRVIRPSEYPEHGLCRVQWEGPWTAPGSNPKWAYWYTHWIHVIERGGWRTGKSWAEEIAPALMATNKRCSGKFTITHSWEVQP